MSAVELLPKNAPDVLSVRPYILHFSIDIFITSLFSVA